MYNEIFMLIQWVLDYSRRGPLLYLCSYYEHFDGNQKLIVVYLIYIHVTLCIRICVKLANT